MWIGQAVIDLKEACSLALICLGSLSERNNVRLLLYF